MVMKKLKISIVITAVLMLAACQSLDFNLFPTFESQFSFEINDTTGIVYEEDFLPLEALNDSLGDILIDGLIEEIDFEGFYLNFTLYEDNLADSVLLNAYIKDPVGQNLAVFEDFFVDVSSIEEGVDYPLYDYLNEEGVEELRTVILDLIEDPDKYDHVIVLLNGDSYPHNVSAHVGVEVHFRINAKVSPLGD